MNQALDLVQKLTQIDFNGKYNFSLHAKKVNDFLNSFSASGSRLGRVKKFESATGLEVRFYIFIFAA